MKNKLENKNCIENFNQNFYEQKLPSKDFVYLNDHRYDDAVEFFNRRYPLDTKDLKTFIFEWTQNSNRYLTSPIQIEGGNPSFLKINGKIQSDSPKLDFPLFKVKNNRYYFSNDLLKHFAEFCFKCSLRFCNNGEKCPMKHCNDTYSVCEICQKGLHSNSECLLY